MLTTKEISEMLSISEETVRRWIRTGELKAIQEGKSYFVEKNDLMKLVQQKASTTNSSIGKMASLIPLIGAGAIAGETILKMLTKKNLSESEKVEKKELSLKDISYHLESLKRRKKKLELEFEMKILEIDEEIAKFQKIQDELNKQGE
jgi:excisionase family DNA binding protein